MTMPAGKYYVGDLCYVLGSVWDEICNLIFFNMETTSGEYTLKNGTRIAIYNTKHGDGDYPIVGTDVNLPVDSGTIGCVLVSSLSSDSDLDSGRIHHFMNEFNTDSYGGKIIFGTVCVETDFGDGDVWDIEEDWDTVYD